MKEEMVSELIDVCTEMIQKQDEIIYRLMKIVESQSTAFQLLKNDAEYSDPELDLDMKIVKECIDEYEEIKGTIEP